MNIADRRNLIRLLSRCPSKAVYRPVDIDAGTLLSKDRWKFLSACLSHPHELVDL